MLEYRLRLPAQGHPLPDSGCKTGQIARRGKLPEGDRQHFSLANIPLVLCSTSRNSYRDTLYSYCDTLFLPEDLERLQAIGEVRYSESDRPLSVHEAIELLRGCSIAVGSWNSPFPSAELVTACPDLRLWEHAAGTVKHMFGPHLEGRDLTIDSNTAPTLTSLDVQYGGALSLVQQVFSKLAEIASFLPGAPFSKP